MPFAISKLVGAEFPLFAFSHCRDVVAAVSRAGGFGVLGGSSFTPESLEVELAWIDEHVDGKPYGVDFVVPEHQNTSGGMDLDAIISHIPQKHRDFVLDVLACHEVSLDPNQVINRQLPPTLPDIGEQLMDVAFRHPIRLIANALGVPPQSMIERARKHGVPVAALVGAKEHAIRQVEAGVDILVAQGTEAGGHCGEITTMVLVPEVIRAITPIRPVPVLAAGGIVTGEQMAGAMAMGAAGAWTGSVWLATSDAETSETIKRKIVETGSRGTIRSKARTGKYSRQIHSAWHDAWEGPGSPGVLPMPLMSMLSQPALVQIEKAADAGNPKAHELATYWVGQGTGLISEVRSATAVVQTFKEDFAEAIGNLLGQLD
jgi:NAD(P)H-dependent flavin oxidoreductase YrpB (nitropropane dioxygenase family)